MPSKYVDPSAIIQVVGNIYNNPKLLDYTDKYIITEEDFSQELHKIIFGAIYKIYELGADKITLENISDFLSTRPKYQEIYKQEKGEEWLLQASKSAIKDAFDYYYMRMKKFSLLRAYDRNGVDVKFLYDPDNILDIKKKQFQEDQLDNSTIEDIANKVDKVIEDIKLNYVSNTFGEAVQAGDGIDELIESLKEKPEVGIPMYGSLINTVTRGARLRKFYLRSAPTGVGKALDNESILPTPAGDKLVKDIKVGDFLFGSDGRPTKVIAVYPQPEKKQVYEITFDDGSKVRCCGEHLWTYIFRSHRTKNRRTETTEDILKRSTKMKNGLKECGKDIPRYRLPLVAPLEYEEKQHKLSPYAYGLSVRGKLDDEYKYDSAKNRTALLQGFMDRNGSVDRYTGTANFNTRNKDLCFDMIDICRSLGYKATFLTSEIELRFEYNPLYRVLIDTSEEDRVNLFRAKMKIDIIKKNISSKRRTLTDVGFLEIKKTDEFADMTCFTVEAEDSLFVGPNYKLTHNTRTMIADICNIGCDKIYDDLLGWIRNGIKEPCLYITTEQDKSEIQTMMLAFLSNVNEEHILNGRYDGDEETRIKEAAQILQDSPVFIEELPDFSLQDVEDAIKKNIRDHGVKYVGFDYIHTSLKILEEISSRSGGVKIREDNVLFMLSARLKDLCNKYGIWILSSTQLNGTYIESETPDQNLLRGSKAIADRVDLGMILLPVTAKDIESLQNVISSNVFTTPNIKLSIYKNRRGRYKGVYLWCKSDLGTCRVQPMFCTTYDYQMVQIEDWKINVEESAF